MFASKETRHRRSIHGARGRSDRAKPAAGWRHALLGLAVAAVVVAGLMGGLARSKLLAPTCNAPFSPNGTSTRGITTSLAAVCPRTGGFFWSEALILALAVAGSARFHAERVAGVDGSGETACRLHAVDDGVLCADPIQDTLVSSRIPVRHDSAGGRRSRRPRSDEIGSLETSGGGVVTVCVAHLVYQAVFTSRPTPRPAHPYAYAHTTGVYAIRDRLQGLAPLIRRQGDARSVISRENVCFAVVPAFLPACRVVRGVGDQMKPASVIITSPDMEPLWPTGCTKFRRPAKGALREHASPGNRFAPGVELKGT